jgi:hypothetical protein
MVSKSMMYKGLACSSDNTYYVLSIALDYIARKSGHIRGLGRMPQPWGKQGVPFVYDHPKPPTPLYEKLRTKLL